MDLHNNKKKFSGVVFELSDLDQVLRRSSKIGHFMTNGFQLTLKVSGQTTIPKKSSLETDKGGNFNLSSF